MANSIAKNLSKNLGGNWKYHPPFGLWTCDDNIRYIQKCSVLGGMLGDEHIGTQVWLYNGGSPERAEEYMTNRRKMCNYTTSYNQ